LESQLSLFLPKDLLTHFDLTEVKELGEVTSKKHIYQIHLVEKNILPASYSIEDYESKGFYLPKIIQDFPIRGKASYLLIKRRRWRHKESGKIITSDYSFIAEGSKITEELSCFLKGAN